MTDERMGGAQPLGYHIETYGCQMNVRDSETMAGLLESLGMRRAASMQEADVIVFNTCCVRDHAERRVFGNVGFTRLIKEERPDAVIAVCGCMMQQREVAVRLFDRFPFVSLVFGTHVLHRLPEMIRRALAGERLCVTDEDDLSIVEGLPARRAPGQSAFVNIMFGCNNFCTYCIVPYVRGRERSRTPEAVEQEVRALAQEGYTEITLLGQNVNSYGRGLPEGTDFPALLRRLNGVDGIRRIRFMTSHPKDLSDGLIEAMATLDKVCPHIHLPLQSGSDAVLQAMNRRYTREQYAATVAKLRAAVPEVELTTDIIVGFPGETEEDFLDTMDMMRRIGFAAAYTFQYSPRAGTRAARHAGAGAVRRQARAAAPPQRAAGGDDGAQQPRLYRPRRRGARGGRRQARRRAGRLREAAQLQDGVFPGQRRADRPLPARARQGRQGQFPVW